MIGTLGVNKYILIESGHFIVMSNYLPINIDNMSTSKLNDSCN